MSKAELKRQQAKWYAALKESGFNDIEDHDYEDKPLKKWSGVSSGFDVISQEPLTPIQSSFPEKRFVKEELLLNHAEFDEICGAICGHGNHKLLASQVRAIWELYVNGETNRAIAKSIAINHVTVYRCIASLTKWAETMGEEPEVSTVILREYDKERDAPMVYATWRNSLWFDTADRDESQNHRFFRECTRTIKDILSNPHIKVQIACLSDDPNLILGVSVMDKTNLIWVYVKGDYRARGIARLLCKGFTSVANPSTRIGKAIVKNKELKING